MAVIRATNEPLAELTTDTPEAMTAALLLPWPVVRAEARERETWIWVDSPDHGPDEQLRLWYRREGDQVILDRIESIGGGEGS